MTDDVFTPELLNKAMQAIDAQPIVMAQGQVNLSTGRPVHFGVPRDLTDEELLELVSWLAAPSGLRAAIRQAAGPTIALPGGMILPTRG